MALDCLTNSRIAAFPTTAGWSGASTMASSAQKLTTRSTSPDAAACAHARLVAMRAASSACGSAGGRQDSTRPTTEISASDRMAILRVQVRGAVSCPEFSCEAANVIYASARQLRLGGVTGAKLLGEPDEKSFGASDVAEPIRLFVLNHFADELRATPAEPDERLVDVVHSEHDAPGPLSFDGGSPFEFQAKLCL